MRRAIVVGLLAGFLLGGCGGGGGGDEAEVSDVVTAFITAGNERDAGAACALLDKAQAARMAQLGGGTCKASLAGLFKGGSGGASQAEVTIDDVRIDGDRATVDATLKRGGAPAQTRSILLVREGGEWRLASAGI